MWAPGSVGAGDHLEHSAGSRHLVVELGEQCLNDRHAISLLTYTNRCRAPKVPNRTARQPERHDDSDSSSYLMHAGTLAVGCGPWNNRITCERSCRRSSDHQQVRADADHRGLRFEQPSHLEQIGTAAWIRQSRRQVREEPPRALHPVHAVEDQTRAHHFRAKLFGAMKVRRGEVVEPLGRVPMLALPEVSLNDDGKPRILIEVTVQAVQRRAPSLKPAFYSDTVPRYGSAGWCVTHQSRARS